MPVSSARLSSVPPCRLPAIRAPSDLDEAPFDLSDRKTPHNGPIAEYY
ncbi:hypothetical protein [Roseiarcus sp.]